MRRLNESLIKARHHQRTQEAIQHQQVKLGLIYLRTYTIPTHLIFGTWKDAGNIFHCTKTECIGVVWAEI